MKRIKSEENHEKTNDVNFQGTIFLENGKKKLPWFQKKGKGCQWKWVCDESFGIFLKHLESTY